VPPRSSFQIVTVCAPARRLVARELSSRKAHAIHHERKNKRLTCMQAGGSDDSDSDDGHDPRAAEEPEPDADSVDHTVDHDHRSVENDKCKQL